MTWLCLLQIISAAQTCMIHFHVIFVTKAWLVSEGAGSGSRAKPSNCLFCRLLRLFGLQGIVLDNITLFAPCIVAPIRLSVWLYRTWTASSDGCLYLLRVNSVLLTIGDEGEIVPQKSAKNLKLWCLRGQVPSCGNWRTNSISLHDVYDWVRKSPFFCFLANIGSSIPDSGGTTIKPFFWAKKRFFDIFNFKNDRLPRVSKKRVLSSNQCA